MDENIARSAVKDLMRALALEIRGIRLSGLTVTPTRQGLRVQFNINRVNTIDVQASTTTLIQEDGDE